MVDILSEPVKYVARRAQTIGNSVSPSTFVSKNPTSGNWLSTTGFHKCGHSVCKACGFAITRSAFKAISIPNSKPFTIKGFLNCCTKNTIYTIECIACNLQYIGCSSTELKVRIRRHLSDISNINAVNMSAASRHFVTEHNRNVSSFKFSAIEKVKVGHRGGDTKKLLLVREAFWIFHLHTRHPWGLNYRQDLRYQY